MLSDEDFELLARWRIRAFGQKLREICMDEGMDSLTFEEKVGLCIEAERTAREDRKIQKAVRAARFKLPGACIEDIAYLPDRTLGRDRIARLASCAWIAANENLVILSESGGGKSYVAQALGNAACRKLLTVRYVRLNDMFRELNIARSEGARRLLRSQAPHTGRLPHHADRGRKECNRPVRDTRVSICAGRHR